MTTPLNIIVAAGTSNNLGFGDDLSLVPVPAPDTVYKFDSVAQSIVPVTAANLMISSAFASTGGMYQSLGIRLNQLLNEKVCFVQCCLPGAQTAIAADPGQLNWEAGGILVNGTINWINSAMDAARLAGYEPRLRCMIYLGGEADGFKLVTNPGLFTPGQYLNARLRMFDYFRAALGRDLLIPQIKIGAATGPNVAMEPGLAKIRAVQDTIASVDFRSPMVFADAYTFVGLGWMRADDGYHWKQIAQNYVGPIVADSIFSLM